MLKQAHLPLHTQAEVAETAGAVGHAAGLLSELLSLVPSGGTPLAVSGSTRQGSLRGRGAEVQAGRDAWLWGHAEMADGATSTPATPPSGVCVGAGEETR
jgi:hypothetical protein